MQPNPYQNFRVPRGQCNSPGAASAADRAAAKREFKRETVRALDESIEAEIEPFRPRK